MHFANKGLAAAGAGFAVAAIVGCGGSSGLLNASQADNLNSQLQQASQALTNHQCGAAQTALRSVSNSIDALRGVDQSLIGNLQQGVKTTQALALKECPTRTRTQTTTTATVTTPTTTATTTTTPSTTTTTATTTTTTTTATTTTSTTPTTTTTTTPTTSTSPSSGGSGLPTGSAHLAPRRYR